MINRSRFLLTVLLLALLLGCLGDFQDHGVNPTEQPHYTLWGSVLDGVDNSPVANAKVVIEMTYSHSAEWYEGNWVDIDTLFSDSLGQYSMDSLYLGQYHILVYRDGDLCYSKSIDFFQYSDREYDIVIPGPPNIDFRGIVNRCQTTIKVSEAQLTLTPIELLDGAVFDEQISYTTHVGTYVFKDVYPGYYLLRGHKWTYYPYTRYVTIDEDGSGYFEFDFCMGYLGNPNPR